MRIVNTDRNDQNILIKKHFNEEDKEIIELIPIDHSLSLPDSLELYEFSIPSYFYIFIGRIIVGYLQVGLIKHEHLARIHLNTSVRLIL